MSPTHTAGPHAVDSRFSFTNSVLELEDAGYTSMGFCIEYDEICCLECDKYHPANGVLIGGMIRYESAAGEGHVFPLGCPNCGAKGLLFAGPELRAGGSGDVVKVLAARARATPRSS
ncbi:MAG: hypothetical protein HYX32_08280 [Actinobacteria bacterium]|nr:hypothetical protein [Actinomycetota bacterium]